MIGPALAAAGSVFSGVGGKLAVAAGVGLVLAGVVIWALVERGRVSERDATIAGVEAVRDKLSDANQGLADALDRVATYHAIELGQVVADRDRAAARAAKVSTIMKGINNAPASDDGPVAPVLGNALERLRGLAADDRQPRPGRVPDAAGRAAGLPGKPIAAGGQ